MAITSIVIGLTDLILTDFLKWQEIKARDAAYKPSAADKEEYLASVHADTSAKIEAEVAAEQGKAWSDRQPPKTE